MLAVSPGACPMVLPAAPRPSGLPGDRETPPSVSKASGFTNGKKAKKKKNHPPFKNCTIIIHKYLYSFDLN